MINTSTPIMKTSVGELVLDLVIPYIHNVDDRSSVSLVSRKFYQTDGITRKRLTVHVHYYPNPASLSKRFPFIESLTLKGPPFSFEDSDSCDIRITPWIQQLALEFRSLKELHILRLAVNDEDLETLARTRGKDLRSLKIKMCDGYSTDGLRHVSKYCNQLRTLCLNYNYNVEVKDGIWLHQLALNSTVLEKLDIACMNIPNAEYLTLLAKNCCNSLISLKLGMCYLSELVDAFKYAVRLEHFSGEILYEEFDLVGFKFPQNMCSISMEDFLVTKCLIVFPYLNRIRKLKLGYIKMDAECQCLLFKRCPNLEILTTDDECGDGTLQVIGEFCKKLRKLTLIGPETNVTHVGLIALGKGCINLESLAVRIGDISNEALECVGTHLKNLRHFHLSCYSQYRTSISFLNVDDENNIRDLPLDNGIQTMQMSCSELESLHIIDLWHGELTDMGLEYIGKYGVNLRSLALEFERKSNIGLVKLSNAGLLKLSEGCLKLRKVELTNCGFSEQVATSYLFNIPSLRYYVATSGLALTRPEFEHRNIGRSELKRKSSTSDEV